MTREMKDSGVEWIGEIPEDWNAVPSNLFFYNSTDKAEGVVEQLTASQKYGVISQKRFMDLESQVPVQKQDLKDLKKVQKGDFVISLRSFQGGIEIAQETGGITPAYTVLKERTKETFSGFYKYFFKSEMYIQALRGTVLDTIRDGKSIRFNNFSMVPIVLPPLAIQKEVTKKLDQIINSVDSIISDTHNSIIELKKYKQSLITDTVTKGLNKNAEMKDSGIEWIGEVPKDWNILKARFFLQEVSEKNYPEEQVLSLYRDFGVVLKSSRNDNHNVTSQNTSTYKLVKKKQLVINKMKAWQGSMAISNYRGIISPAYYVYDVTDRKINLKFLNYTLRNNAYLDEYRRISQGLRIGQWDLNKSEFKNIKYVIPRRIEEQNEIVDFLDEKTAKIDQLISDKGQLIKEYESYKKSLIYEYVTGKKEV